MSVSVLGSGAVRTLLIDRPHAKNALDVAAIEAIGAAADGLKDDPELAALIVRGGSDHFVAGGDLKDFTRVEGMAAALALSEAASSAFARLASLPAVVIAAIDGDAYGGGCELALFADLRVMAAESRFVWKQLDIGLMTGFGGGLRLVRQVGYARAMLWLSTAAAVGAGEAQAAGLVERVAAPGRTAREEAESIAEAIRARPLPSLRAQKAALLEGLDLSIPEATRAEARRFAATWGSQAHIAAVARFSARKRGETAD